MCVKMSPGRRYLLSSVVERLRRVVAAEVDHHRNVGLASGLDRARHRLPLRSHVVGHLHADDHVLVGERPLGGELRVHVAEVLLDGAALHAVPHDVQEGEDAGLRPIDDLGLELREVAPARAADVHHRRLPGAERVAVGRHRAGPVAVLRVLRAPEQVGVDVDEAGRDVQPSRVDHPCGVCGRNVGGDGRDLPVGDRDVPHGVDAVARVDDVARP